MNAAQMYYAAEQALPDLTQQISQGDFTQLNQWQKDKIWSQGSFYSIDELMIHATGETLNSLYYLQHLRNRFLP